MTNLWEENYLTVKTNHKVEVIGERIIIYNYCYTKKIVIEWSYLLQKAQPLIWYVS